MAKKRKKKKRLSRRERKAHPERVASPPAESGNPAANVPEPDAESLSGSQPEAEAAQSIPVKATFKPSAPPAGSASAEPADQAEYTAVKKDLRKLWLTIGALALIVAGLAVWNAQTGVISDLGGSVFSWVQ